VTRPLVTVAALLACGACAGGFLRPYEYEEDIYLALDGTATVTVNGSIAAFDALRGASFDVSPGASLDRAAIQRYFATPVARVTRSPRTWRRSGRRFVQVRIDVDDVTRLSEARPFAWSRYRFARAGNSYVYKQTVGASADKSVGDVGWTGRELVAFRLHLPSKITFHEKSGMFRRGNILVWEQRLSDRLRGVPLTLEARMETQSILYRTLWLFGATCVAVALTFGAIIWWIAGRGPARAAEAKT
jgi:hypothetical protein